MQLPFYIYRELVLFLFPAEDPSILLRLYISLLSAQSSIKFRLVRSSIITVFHMKCVPTSVLALFINPLSLFVLCALIDTEQYRALRPRAITAVDAGIGIELECRKFSFDNLGYRAASASAEEIKAIKGKTILPAEYHGVQSSAGEWELTAELTGPEDTWRLRRVCAEFIVSGEKVKLGRGNAARIGKEISGFLLSSPVFLSHKINKSSYRINGNRISTIKLRPLSQNSNPSANGRWLNPRNGAARMHCSGHARSQLPCLLKQSTNFLSI